MEDRNKNIDKYFRDSLNGFEQSPPESNWEAIASRIGKKKTKSKVFLTFRIAAGITVFISAGFGIYMLTKSGNVPDSKITFENKQIHEKEFSKDKTNKEKEDNHENFEKVQNMTNNFKQANSTNIILNTREKNIGVNVEIRKEEENVINLNSKENLLGKSPLIKNRISEIYETKKPKFYPIPNENYEILRENRAITNKTLNKEEIIQILLADNNEIPEKEKIKKHNWKLGSEIAPLYSHRSIKSASSDLVNNYNDSESGILAYAGGIKITYKANRRISIQSGVYFSRYGQQKNDVETYYGSYAMDNISESRTVLLKIKNSTGDITGLSENAGDKILAINKDNAVQTENNPARYGFSSGNESDYSVKQIFDYFELPLVLKYKIIDGKFDFNLSGGLITNFLIGNKVKIIQNDNVKDIGKTENINDINYQGSLGIGMEYAFRSNFEFTLEPRFSYYLNSVEKSSLLDVKPYSLGFYAGFNYRF